MKSLIGLISVVLILALGGCANAAEPAKMRGEWVPAFTGNFSSADPIKDAFNFTWGTAEAVDGKAVITSEKRRGRLVGFVDNLEFPKNVRVEMTASVAPVKPGPVVMGICLKADGYDASTCYLLQVGRGSALLKKNNVNVESTVHGDVTVKAGQTYKLVAEDDGGKISLSVDGEQMFSFTDDAPIAGPGHAAVGLFAPGGILTIEKLVVLTRGGADEVITLPTKAPDGPAVTLKGIAVCSRNSAPTPISGDHTIQFYAYEGTDAAKATIATLLEKDYAVSMDVEAARHFQAKMDEQARYFIASNHLSRKTHDEVHYFAQKWAVTGVLFEKDGKKWIWPTKIEETKLEFPDKMQLTDKPLVMPKEQPITLAIAEGMSLKCVPIPAGRFLQGSPYYVTRWQDEFAHEVVLTKSFFMAEHPITQEMYEAVMHANPSKRKGELAQPNAPVENVAYADVAKFCEILSEKSGRVVRLPTDAEWEYAARVGTSNPCLTKKYEPQNARGGVAKVAVAVKTKQPNAWGLYDMVGAGWEADSDWAADDVRIKQIDPQGPAEKDPSTRNYGKGPVRKSKGGEYYEDYRPSMHGAWNKDGSGAEGLTTFRVVVEAAKPQ